VADAMEMMILSILAPALQCAWGITQVEQATITTVVFLGKTLSKISLKTLFQQFISLLKVCLIYNDTEMTDP